MQEIKLTQYSHGAGCGCKIAPAVLEKILKSDRQYPDDKRLLVGNGTSDDAAVFDIGNGQGLISTTDFFMPIVDSPFDFGRIASVNAISDVYAMGGIPVLAIAVLGWPIVKIPAETAAQVLEGSRTVCAQAGISLAGGHSIDSPEPIFGLAVNGLVDISNLKKNNTAQAGDVLFLTKPLGTGILGTAIKKSIINAADYETVVSSMCRLNKAGIKLGKLSSVHAMTDVTGFGLLGHLMEMTEGSDVSAVIELNKISFLPHLDFYLEKNCVPGGTLRNWNSYGDKVSCISERTKHLLCDPQTSGGLLVAVAPGAVDEFLAAINRTETDKCSAFPIGRITDKKDKRIFVDEK